MTQNKENSPLDRMVAEGLSGREKLKVLLVNRAGSVGRWAVDRKMFPEQVKMCLAGTREYPEIRDAIAADLGLSREEVDEALATPQPA